MDSRDKNQMTPMHVAVNSGRLGMVKLLAEKGAKFLADSAGTTAMDYAAMNGRKEIERYLAERKDYGPRGWTPLHKAIYEGLYDKVTELVKCGHRSKRRFCWENTTTLSM